MSRLKKKIGWSFFIFFIVFCLLGIPYTNWGFCPTDDFGNFFHSQIKSWKQFLHLFYDQCTLDVCRPSNYIIHKDLTFSAVSYRPFMFVFSYLSTVLFGSSAYVHFLITIFFHALNSSVLFYLFLYFTSLVWAFLLAMFFAFHPSLAGWLGWIGAQQYQIGLFSIFISLFLFKRYLDTRKTIYWWFCAVPYVVTLLGKESIIVFPAVVFFGSYLYEKKVLNINIVGFWKNIWRYIYLTTILWIPSLLYLLFRAILFPPNFAGRSFGFFSLSSMKQNACYAICYATDILGLGWFPWGHPCLKSFIFALIVLVFIYFFMRNSQKLTILFFVFCVFVLLWPAVMRGHYTRYVYETLPFFIFAFLFCIRFYKGNLNKFKRASFILFSLLIIFNAFYLIVNMKLREKNFHKIELAFDELVADPQTKNRPICFIAIPANFGPGLTQAIWLRDENSSRPVYCDSAIRTSVDRNYSLLEYYFGVKIKHFFDTNTQWLDENYLKIVPIKNGLQFVSLNSEKLWFTSCWDIGSNKYIPVGKYIIDKVDPKNNTYEASMIFDDKILKQDPVFVTWNYEDQKFWILNES